MQLMAVPMRLYVDAPSQADAPGTLFVGHVFHLSPALPPTILHGLDQLIQVNGGRKAIGGVEDEELTVVITISERYEGWEVVERRNREARRGGGDGKEGGEGEIEEKRIIEVVTPTWAERSILLEKLQEPQHFSPLASMIFSGICACACPLPSKDLETISAGITALGGQWRSALTNEVTHLIALDKDSPKYATGMHYQPQTGVKILLPHWFDDCVRLGMRVDEDPYLWPDVRVLKGVEGVDVEGMSAKARVAFEKEREAERDMGKTEQEKEQERIRRNVYATAALFTPAMDGPAQDGWKDSDVILVEGLSKIPTSSNPIGNNVVATSNPNISSVSAFGPISQTVTETAGQNQVQPQVWGGKRILLSRTLQLSGSRLSAVHNSITRSGGIVLRFQGDADEQELGPGVDPLPHPAPVVRFDMKLEEKTAVRRILQVQPGGVLELLSKKEKERREKEWEIVKEGECDVFVTRWRHGRAYVEAVRQHKTIGTLAWLFHVQSTGILSRPLDQLLHYPTPKRPIEGFEDYVISVTNYTGEAREYLKKLIHAMGAVFTPSMSGHNSQLVAAYIHGTKAQKALSWSIPVINHLWLEDVYCQWRNLTPAVKKYIDFPEGVDFSKLLGVRPVPVGVPIPVRAAGQGGVDNAQANTTVNVNGSGLAGHYTGKADADGNQIAWGRTEEEVLDRIGREAEEIWEELDSAEIALAEAEREREKEAKEKEKKQDAKLGANGVGGTASQKEAKEVLDGLLLPEQEDVEMVDATADMSITAGAVMDLDISFQLNDDDTDGLGAMSTPKRVDKDAIAKPKGKAKANGNPTPVGAANPNPSPKTMVHREVDDDDMRESKDMKSKSPSKVKSKTNKKMEVEIQEKITTGSTTPEPAPPKYKKVELESSDEEKEEEAQEEYVESGKRNQEKEKEKSHVKPSVLKKHKEKEKSKLSKRKASSDEEQEDVESRGSEDDEKQRRKEKKDLTPIPLSKRAKTKKSKVVDVSASGSELEDDANDDEKVVKRGPPGRQTTIKKSTKSAKSTPAIESEDEDEVIPTKMKVTTKAKKDLAAAPAKEDTAPPPSSTAMPKASAALAGGLLNRVKGDARTRVKRRSGGAKKKVEEESESEEDGEEEEMPVMKKASRAGKALEKGDRKTKKSEKTNKGKTKTKASSSDEVESEEEQEHKSEEEERSTSKKNKLKTTAASTSKSKSTPAQSQRTPKTPVKGKPLRVYSSQSEQDENPTESESDDSLPSNPMNPTKNEMREMEMRKRELAKELQVKKKMGSKRGREKIRKSGSDEEETEDQDEKNIKKRKTTTTKGTNTVAKLKSKANIKTKKGTELPASSTETEPESEEGGEEEKEDRKKKSGAASTKAKERGKDAANDKSKNRLHRVVSVLLPSLELSPKKTIAQQSDNDEDEVRMKSRGKARVKEKEVDNKRKKRVLFNEEEEEQEEEEVPKSRAKAKGKGKENSKSKSKPIESPTPKRTYTSKAKSKSKARDTDTDEEEEEEQNSESEVSALVSPRTKRALKREESLRAAAGQAAGVPSISAVISTKGGKTQKPTTTSASATGPPRKKPTTYTTTKPDSSASMPPPPIPDREGSQSQVSLSANGRASRAASIKASQKLHETIMPDVLNYEAQKAKAARRHGSRVSDAFVVEGDNAPSAARTRKDKRKSVGGDEDDEGAEEHEEGGEREVKRRKVVDVDEGKEKKRGGKGRKKEIVDDDDKMDVDSADAPGNDVMIMTTQVNIGEDIVKALLKLGMKITTRPSECTHLLAPNVVRTEKFLCALASRAPHIVTAQWAIDCAKQGKVLPESDYPLPDQRPKENKYQTDLVKSIQRAKEFLGGSKKLLDGHTFYITPKVKVDIKLLKNVVAACGGQISSQTPTLRIINAAPSTRHVISSPEDITIWRPIAAGGFKVYTQELVLTGVLRMEMEWENETFVVDGWK